MLADARGRRRDATCRDRAQITRRGALFYLSVPLSFGQGNVEKKIVRTNECLIYFCMRDACKYTLCTASERILFSSFDSGQV